MRTMNPEIIAIVLDSMRKIGDSLHKSRVQKKRRDRDYLIGHFCQQGIDHPQKCDCRFPSDEEWHKNHGPFNHEYHVALQANGFLSILREAAEKDLLTGNEEYGQSGALKSWTRKVLDGFLVDEPDQSWF
jgi:hypothetical protein